MALSESMNNLERDTDFGVPLRSLEERLGIEIVHLNVPDTEANPVIRAIDIYDATNSDIGGEGVLLCLVSAEAMRLDELDRAVSIAAASGCVGIAAKVTTATDPQGSSALLQLTAREG